MDVQKNTAAVDKIISKLCLAEFKRANPKPKIRKDGTFNYHPYSPTDEINEFRQLKSDYINDVISEEEYKAACLKFNMRRD